MDIDDVFCFRSFLQLVNFEAFEKKIHQENAIGLKTF